VETFEGQRIPGAAYSWSAPAGTTLPQDPAKPYLTATNKVGKYKVTVAFTGSTQTCQLETDISATPCQTFTDGSCTDTKTPITNTTPPVNINNLGVGDVFQAGDYDVTVTNISAGSQGNGWTGTGLVNQNLIGQIQMPLTVEFQNIKVNECYQYFDRGINGAVVQTKVDETWGSVVSVDELDIIKLLKKKLQSIEDNALTIECSKTEIILDDISALKNKIQSENIFSDEHKTQLLNKISALENVLNGLITCLSCQSQDKPTNCDSFAPQLKPIISEIISILEINYSPEKDELEGGTDIRLYPFFSDESYSNARMISGDWVGCRAVDFIIAARNQGVEQEVFTNNAGKSSKDKQQQFMYRLGRIFEMTALKSLGYNSTNGKQFALTDKSIRTANVKPDQIQGGAVKITYKTSSSQTETKWYQWPESVFIEAKFTNLGDRVISVNVNNNQLRGYFDVLSNMDNARYTKTRGWFPALQASFVPKKLRAVNYGAAAIHLIVPSDVTLDPLILTEAAAKNIKIYLSFLEWRPIDSILTSEKHEFRVSVPTCKNCTSLRSANTFLTTGELPMGNITYGKWDTQ
jgi:hypothetical protein